MPLLSLLSLDYADIEKFVRHIRDHASEPALPKSAANLKEGSTDWQWTGMEISIMSYEVSKPSNEKYITVFKYFFSFIGLRFYLNKTFKKDSVKLTTCWISTKSVEYIFWWCEASYITGFEKAFFPSIWKKKFNLRRLLF